ncbi:thioredoxin family protein [Streptomyces gelaticus]
MRITVLTVPECPNGPVVRERITAALTGRQAEVQLVEVSDQAEAERAGMTGSPTVLLDGVDPFARAGAVPSVSCRIYREADGRADGAPSVKALSKALSAAGPAAPADADC